ncbi:unnamed protein product [Calicophoron daubneyi]|uniref:HCLS1-associated protein X-1 n=1 Tax=Calicophoron daubneyi TaxID=300641 RepID=A0AAV2U232_CALDB
MDRLFERLEEVFDDFVFSGFMPHTRRPQSPREEMLRGEENDANDPHELPVPEPWTPFPFYGDLVKPDMMDRQFFDESMRRRREESEPRRDVVLDDDAPATDLTPHQRWSISKWSQSFSRKTFIGPDGQVTESETSVLQEPDGTKVQTTVERSPQGERKRIVRKKPTGEEEVQESNTDFGQPRSALPEPKPSTGDQGPDATSSTRSLGGMLHAFKRWCRGEG